jgi:hypothetical protein
MEERMSRITFPLLGFLMIFSLAMQSPDALDGYSWKVKVTPIEMKDAKEFDDTLSFKANMFSSAALAKKGFKPVAFDSDVRRFGPAAFTAVQKSDAEGSAKWTGTVTGVSISGDLVWTKKDGTEVHYSFSGERSDQ